MCGIVGAFLKQSDNRFPIRAMADAVKHRGPDDEGYVLIDPERSVFDPRKGADTRSDVRLRALDNDWPENARLIFGHRRLSIIDLSWAAHQPMTDRENRFWITYNGEIYNYRELRQELERLGARFQSESDTEVILEAYKAWGEDCLGRFNGMWAFALWDSVRKVLFCARDRYGVKPFYYTWAGKDFLFASEIKALLVPPQVKKEISEEAVFDYLAFALHNRADRTFFSGICLLEPGSKLTLDLEGKVTLRKWYTFPQSIGLNPYTAESPRVFRDLLADAVRLRLRSDVRVGSCLSGGLDSSSIVCLAQRQMLSPIHTISSCFENGLFDERKFIASVVQKTQAVSHFVFPDGKQFWQEWPKLIYQQEEPFGSTSIYAQWCVIRAARHAEIPVLLDGQGGDELLAGYLRYRRNQAVAMMLRGDLRGFHLALANPKAFGFFGFNFLPASFCAFVTRQAAQCSGYLKRDFLKRHLPKTREWVIERGVSQRSVSEALRSDFVHHSLPALLRYEDKNSMSFSVETRLPFLDYRLVEWVFGLEDTAKIHENTTKWILREGMKEVLPELVRLRSDKMGFVTPEHDWLREGKSVLMDLFHNPSQSLIAPWIQADKIKRIVRSGGPWNQFIWRAVNLELWLRVFFNHQAKKFHEYSHHQPILSA